MKDTPSPLIHNKAQVFPLPYAGSMPCLKAGGHLSWAEAVLTTAGWTKTMISTKDSSLAPEPACLSLCPCRRQGLLPPRGQSRSGSLSYLRSWGAHFALQERE